MVKYRGVNSVKNCVFYTTPISFVKIMVLRELDGRGGVEHQYGTYDKKNKLVL